MPENKPVNKAIQDYLQKVQEIVKNFNEDLAVYYDKSIDKSEASNEEFNDSLRETSSMADSRLKKLQEDLTALGRKLRGNLEGATKEEEKEILEGLEKKMADL